MYNRRVKVNKAAYVQCLGKVHDILHHISNSFRCWWSPERWANDGNEVQHEPSPRLSVNNVGPSHAGLLLQLTKAFFFCFPMCVHILGIHIGFVSFHLFLGILTPPSYPKLEAKVLFHCKTGLWLQGLPVWGYFLQIKEGTSSCWKCLGSAHPAQ